MSAEYDAINKIRAAESDAVAIRQAAIETVRAVKAEAERNAAVLLDRAAAEAETISKRIIEEASVNANKQKADAAEKAEEKAKKMMTEKESRIETAVNFIIERILK